MSRVYVAGVSMTPFGRFLERSVKDLAEQAVREALADAGIGAEAVEAIFFANAAQGAVDGQHSVRGEIALREMPFGNVPVTNVDNACASASTALYLAAMQVRAGMADVVLAVGAEKMVIDDKARSFAIFNGSWDVHGVDATMAGLMRMGEGVPTPPEHESTGPRSVFMDVYQAFAKFHMRTFGTTPRQIAAVSAKNHNHSVHNPRAQYRRPYSVEEVMGARMVAWPITLPMCSPISDGAAAAVVCSEKALARLGRGRAVELRASVLAGGGRRAANDYRAEVSHVAARRAYEMAGVSPADVSVAEVHDATALGEIQQVENLMLCEFGEGGPMAERGETALGGRVPVNPSGGLECKGHPIGATGLGQVYELVTQLRGEAGSRQVPGAKVAVAENGGGLIGAESAACCVTILAR
ncbi:MAG: thiolase family protein [Rhodocyclaceae bacterium]|nr:thiolase family protein [Rhodocyclaceae bacterium]MCA3134558.1 thiolase family protein [Rhodocyclaceae bacterium]MCA3145495.1 thiolase family protein [Rhodocyclaceae bacterium]MCE2898923.1 thiolase family protein [Betaproteobacteria bacterium]